MTYGPPNDPNQQPPQGNYPPQQPGYDPNQQGGYPPQGGYGQPPQGNYPPQQQGYPPQQQGYPPQQQGYRPPSGPNPSSGLQAFSLGRKLVLGGGLAAFILFFLPWYTLNVGFGVGSVSSNGVRGLPLFAWLLVIVLVIAMALPLFGRRLRDIVQLPLTEGQIALYLSAAALVLSVLGAVLNFGGGVGPGIGFFLSVLALAAMTAGGWFMFQARE